MCICTRRHAKPLSVCPKASCACSLLLSHRCALGVAPKLSGDPDPAVVSFMAQINTFQPITRDPDSFRPKLEPASMFCLKSRSSVLGSCPGLQCSFSYTQGFILMSLVEVTLFPVSHGSGVVFQCCHLSPQRCLHPADALCGCWAAAPQRCHGSARDGDHF